jgi:hypothetical protein
VTEDSDYDYEALKKNGGSVWGGMGTSKADGTQAHRKSTHPLQSLTPADTKDNIAVPIVISSSTPAEHEKGTEKQLDYAECRTENLPPELVRLVKAWPNLPESIRADILAMVQATALQEGVQQPAETTHRTAKCRRTGPGV